jgi:hypothetical protein
MEREAQVGKYVSRVTHEGKQLIVLDVAGKTEAQGLEAWTEMKQELLKEKGVCLILVDTRNITMSPALVNKAREAGMVVKKNPGNRFAFVGLTGLQKSTAQLIADGLRFHAHFTKTPEEAREWLVREED